MLLAAAGVAAYQLNTPRVHHQRGLIRLDGPSRAALTMQAVADDCQCAEPTGGVVVAGRSVTGQSLRDMSLVDASGRRTRAGDLIGDEGKAVVVFLRHLG